MSIKLSCCGSLMKSMASIGCFDLWRALLAEYVGTLLLVLLACGSGVHSGADQPAFFNGIVGIALTAGLTVATVVWCVGDVSGAHINPAVTVSMVMTGRIQLLKAVLYVLVQCAGAISGAACLDAVTPASRNSSLSANTLGADVTAGQAFIVEAVVTFLLLLTVCAALDAGRTLGGSAPLAIGIAVIIGHLFAIPYTGCSMNPARTLGTALIADIWDEHWLYWVAPMSGGAVGALMYEYVFSASADRRKLKQTLHKSLRNKDIALQEGFTSLDDKDEDRTLSI